MTDELGPDPWEEREEFGQLFIRHLAALGRPVPPDSPPPLDVAGYLQMIELGEMIAEYDRTTTSPGFYRDPAYLHGALDAGATWAQLAEATGDEEATTRRRYREWVADQHRLYARGTYEGLDDDQYTAAIKRAEGED